MYVDYIEGNFRVYTRIKKDKIILHRLLTNCPKGLVVDHINGNSLDNRKSNLRICTRSQNNLNSGKPKTKICSSKYIGVAWDGRIKSKPWKAIASVKDKTIHIGYFSSQLKSARARDKFVLSKRGQYARLNFG